MDIKSILFAGVAVAALSSTAQAAQIAALVGGDTIAIVDTAKKQVVNTVKVSGIAGQLLGIDVRPADGMLYGVVDDGMIVTIAMDGKATKKSQLDMPPPKMNVTVDFNPAADRLRVMAADGTSLRINVDDGKVIKDGSHKFAEGDKNKGGKPNVVAGAYSNSVKGAKETTLYNIDAALGALLTQVPPNDGVLNTVGMLGVKADTMAFDIWSDGKGANDAWLLAGGTLYNVDLKTGKATEAARISGLNGVVRDIAILPAM